jgi:hypothetical protein
VALASRIRDAVLLEGRARWDAHGELWEVELWRVQEACGCEVRRDVVFPEDLAAALQSVWTAAAALMDVREILDRQAAEEWAARRAAVKEKKQ